jgi:uncharacterized membrane protein YeaQ/YmgE (transglycosylase-associated protein family)
MWALGALAAATFGGLGGWIAAQRNRGMAEGLLLGALFGPLGALVEAFLPERRGSHSQAEAAEHR